MKLKTQESGDRLEDLSKQKLIGLLRSTYEYKSFTEYFDEHELTYMDRLEDDNKHSCRKAQKNQVNCYSDRQMERELERISQEEDLRLHKYHQDLIFNKFKEYYDRYENSKAHKIRAHYEEKLRKIQKEGEKTLPQDLMEMCIEKEKELTKQVKRKRNKTLRM